MSIVENKLSETRLGQLPDKEISASHNKLQLVKFTESTAHYHLISGRAGVDLRTRGLHRL